MDSFDRMTFVMEHLAANVVKLLVTNRDEFLKCLVLRVGTRETAEDILHAAFVKTLEHRDEIHDEESAVAWFYRVLRNAVVDHHRRSRGEVPNPDRVSITAPIV